jgi:glutamate-1-semialdehyde 2,1-aminomutase
VETILREYPDQVAAVIIEPVAGNMGVVPPTDGFLEGLRALTSDHGALLIFDEVMTGFRVHPGGAQTLYGIHPDLTTLGKVIGGGLPVGAYGGHREIMEMIAPSGPVYQAGTLSGNPLAMTAGLTTLKILRQPGVWESLEKTSTSLADGILDAARSAGIPLWGNRVGTMFSAFFTSSPVRDWLTAKSSDTELFGRYFMGMLERGIYLAPSQFEAGFVSTAHDEQVIETTLRAVREVFKKL